MNDKKSPYVELVIVLLALFLVAILFVMLSPVIFTANVSTPIRILFELLPYILMVTLVIGVIRLRNRPISTSLGLTKHHITKQLLLAFPIFVISISFVIIPLLLGVDKQEVLSFKARSPWILIYYVVKSIVFVGIGEELVWRGYVFERLRRITGRGTWAVLVSSILFGLWHYPIGQNMMQVVMVTGLGLIYGFARLKLKDCTTLSIGIAHGLHDAVILLLSFFLL